MLALLFANKLIEGKLTWKDVPAQLKEQVKELLVNELHRADLISE